MTLNDLNNNRVKIYFWMINELGLKKANVYALLYGLAEETGEARCTIEYMTRRLNTSKSTVIRILNSLEKDGYIKRVRHGTENGYKVYAHGRKNK